MKDEKRAFPLSGVSSGMLFREYLISQVAAGGWNEIYHGIAFNIARKSPQYVSGKDYTAKEIAQTFILIADAIIEEMNKQNESDH